MINKHLVDTKQYLVTLSQNNLSILFNCQSSHMSASHLWQLLRVVLSSDIQPAPSQQLLQASGDNTQQPPVQPINRILKYIYSKDILSIKVCSVIFESRNVRRIFWLLQGAQYVTLLFLCMCVSVFKPELWLSLALSVSLSVVSQSLSEWCWMMIAD